MEKKSVKQTKNNFVSIDNMKSDRIDVNVGDVVEGVVTYSSIDGVNVRITMKEKTQIAFLPAGHMSPCQDVGKLLAAKTMEGQKLSAIVFATKPSLILSTTFAWKEHEIDDLNIGSLVMCTVKKIETNFIRVLVPCSEYLKSSKVLKNNIDNFSSIYEHQILIGKILDFDKEKKEINLSAKLSVVLDQLKSVESILLNAVDLVSMHISKMFELSKNIFFTSRSISKLSIGQRVEGIVELVADNLVIKLDGNVKAVVHKYNYSKSYKLGDKVNGVVLWVDYPRECVYLTLLPRLVDQIIPKQNKLLQISTDVQLRGEIVLIDNWFALAVLKGEKKGVLVCIPVRKNFNDTFPDLSLYKIGGKIRCYIMNKKNNLHLPICLLKAALETKNMSSEKKSLPSKTKNEVQKDNSHTLDTKKLKKIYSEESNLKSKSVTKKRKIEETSTEVESIIEPLNQQISNDVNDNEVKNLKSRSIKKLPAIEKCGFDWENKITNAPSDNITQNISSDSDREEESTIKTQKKKLKPAEKKEKEKEKEKQIRHKEEILTNYQIPQTIDQFDRLVLANPNSSLIWIQYMAHHLQGIEIDRARVVARRALKTINFREETERLNVWLALLNLESRFGSLESLNSVFQEAIKTNDAQKVYEHMLTVHAEAGRHSDLENVAKVMLAKFKQSIETWNNCVSILSKFGLMNQARSIMKRAEQYLTKNEYVEFLVRFAQIENKCGSEERGQALFENILSLYPKRTDIWSKYVDSLIKSKKIDIARKVLDRALTKTMPIKKMKFILKKYLNLEEQYGTPESCSRIKQLAMDYVEEQYNKITS